MADTTHLSRTLESMPAFARDELVRRLHRLGCEGQAPVAPVWLALSALAADVAAEQRRVLDELEGAFDDNEVGEIVDLDSLDTPNDA